MRAPQMCCMARRGLAERSSPMNAILLSGSVRPLAGRNCMMPVATVDLPEPDSPTTPTIWPRRTSI